jgi:hypothetical protein
LRGWVRFFVVERALSAERAFGFRFAVPALRLCPTLVPA